MKFAVMMRVFAVLCILNLFGMMSNGQTSLDEVKRQVYGNPCGAPNENFINMTNEMFDDNSVSLLLFDDWKALEVIGTNNENIIIDSANYQLEADKILFVYKNEMFELFPDKVLEATIENHRFVSLTYEADKREIVRGFFEIVLEGDMRLLKRWELNRQITNDSPLGLPAAREEKYVLTEELYYQASEGRRPAPIPGKKADFIKIFNRDRSKMVDYAKMNRLNPKKSDDVIALIIYFNSLDQ